MKKYPLTSKGADGKPELLDKNEENQSLDFLIAELEHFGESLWRNEEVGEKRFNFFITLITAVIAALVALLESPAELADRKNVEATVLGSLLLFGLFTYLRMLQRNHVTDEYKKTLRYIRNKCVALAPELALYRVPKADTTWWSTWLKGGYAETIGAINAILLGTLLFRYLGIGFTLSVIVSLIFFLLQWYRTGMRSPNKTKKKMPDQYFRAGVGAVIINKNGLLLTLERKDITGSWQFPQGGLDDGEETYPGVLREVEEETAISSEQLELISQYPEPLAYELPPQARKEKTGRGQVQYWYLFRYLGKKNKIDLSKSKEFKAWKWTSAEQAIAETVDFRKNIYTRLLDYFSKYLVKDEENSTAP